MQGFFPVCLPLFLLFFFLTLGIWFLQKGTRPAVNEHVKEKMFSHLMDLTREFGALKIETPGLQAPKGLARRTRGGVEAQEKASQDVRLMNLATLCQQQQTEIDGLRGLVNEMTGTVERLERRLNDSHMRVETPLQELTVRLVTCYAIGPWLLGNPLLQARTAIAATSLAFAPRNLFICGMKEKFVIPSRLLDVRFFLSPV